jgi:hypothetical protein
MFAGVVAELGDTDNQLPLWVVTVGRNVTAALLIDEIATL